MRRDRRSFILTGNVDAANRKSFISSPCIFLMSPCLDIFCSPIFPLVMSAVMLARMWYSWPSCHFILKKSFRAFLFASSDDTYKHFLLIQPRRPVGLDEYMALTFLSIWALRFPKIRLIDCKEATYSPEVASVEEGATNPCHSDTTIRGLYCMYV